MAIRRLKILVCRGPECGDKLGSSRIHAEVERQLAATPHPDVDVDLGWQSCFGHCRRGVNLMVRAVKPGEDVFFSSFLAVAGPGCTLHHGVTIEKVEAILARHLKKP